MRLLVDKEKSLLIDVFVGEFHHYITNDLLKEVAPVHVEQVHEE